jgi:hypothetical protein
MKILPLCRILLCIVPLGFLPAAERLPEFSTKLIGPHPAGDGALQPQRVADPVPEATSWSLAMGALGCFLLVRRRN